MLVTWQVGASVPVLLEEQTQVVIPEYLDVAQRLSVEVLRIICGEQHNRVNVGGPERLDPVFRGAGAGIAKFASAGTHPGLERGRERFEVGLGDPELL